VNINCNRKDPIKGFYNQFSFLSNFHPCCIYWEGLLWPTVENAYQASKTLDLIERIKFQSVSPGKAKRMGLKVSLRPNWTHVKLYQIEALVRLKFTNPDLAFNLIQTDDVDIQEVNTWNDTFWGICNEVGQNHLGKILMKVRKDLKRNICNAKQTERNFRSYWSS
jgi:ribA/ribD-fused uncharacterized protein